MKILQSYKNSNRSHRYNASIQYFYENADEYDRLG